MKDKKYLNKELERSFLFLALLSRQQRHSGALDELQGVGAGHVLQRRAHLDTAPLRRGWGGGRGALRLLLAAVALGLLLLRHWGWWCGRGGTQQRFNLLHAHAFWVRGRHACMWVLQNTTLKVSIYDASDVQCQSAPQSLPPNLSTPTSLFR